MDEWARKGATLSDKTARKEFGLTADQIESAIRAGKLRYRLASMHGNPWLRLLRSDVEDLVKETHGDRYLRQRQVRAELTRVETELRRVRAHLAELEQERSDFTAELGGVSARSPRRTVVTPTTRPHTEVSRRSHCRPDAGSVVVP